MLDMEPRQLMRHKEKEYRELGLKDESLSRAHLISAMVEHPRLIERPVAISGNRAVLGRPTETVLELL
jgi:arsenate reductase